MCVCVRARADGDRHDNGSLAHRAWGIVDPSLREGHRDVPIGSDTVNAMTKTIGGGSGYVTEDLTPRDTASVRVSLPPSSLRPRMVVGRDDERDREREYADVQRAVANERRGR